MAFSADSKLSKVDSSDVLALTWSLDTSGMVSVSADTASARRVRDRSCIGPGAAATNLVTWSRKVGEAAVAGWVKKEARRSVEWW